jgi:hypothetical protein
MLGLGRAGPQTTLLDWRDLDMAALLLLLLLLLQLLEGLHD